MSAPQQEPNFFEAAFSHAAIGMVKVGLDNIVQKSNKSFCDFLEYDETALIGKDFIDFIHSENVSTYIDACEQALYKNDGAIKFEQQYLRKTGSLVWGMTSVVLIRDDQGNPLYFIFQIFEIANKKTQYPHPWQEIFEYAHWGVVLGDADGTLLEQMNPAFASMHGYTVEELTGRHIFDVFHPECRAGLAEQIKTAHRLGHHSFESIHLRKDGSTFPVFIDITTVRDANNAVMYRIVNVQDITERKEAEKVRQHYAAIIESSDDAIIGKSLEGIVTSWNRGAEKIFGYTADEILGKSIDLLLPMDRLAEERNILERIRDGEVISHFETVRRRKDGSLIDISVAVSPMRDCSGKVVGASKIARDITERKLVETLLYKREQEFRALAEHSPDTIARYDRECRRIYANPTLSRLAGMPVESLLGITPAYLFPNLPQAIAYEAKLRETLESGTEGEYEFTWIGHDSRPITSHIRIVPECDAQGQVVSALAIGRDITRRIEAEKQLYEKDQAIRAVLDHSPDIILRYDRQCRRIYANPTAQARFGQPLGEIIGKTPLDFSPLSEAETYMQKIQEVLTDGREIQAEIVTCNIWGENIWAHIRMVPEFAQDGTVASVLAVGRDITALKEANIRIKKSHAQLRGLAARLETIREDERKRIARDMHDELGQYLTALRMGVSVMRMQSGNSDPEVLDQLLNLNVLIDKTIQVVRDMAASLRPAPLDMGIISAIEWLIEEFTRQTGIVCNLETIEEDIHLNETTSTAIFRMLQESLTNVVRHAEASQVDIHFYREENDCVLDVNDNGKGFNPADIKEKSFGLIGLSERAIMLSGTVSISSALNRGTTVSVRIPMTSNENIES